MTDSSKITYLVLDKEKSYGFFRAGSVEGHGGCNYNGQEKEEMVRGKVREKRKRRTMRISGGRAHTSEWPELQMNCTISCFDWQYCCFTLPVCVPLPATAPASTSHSPNSSAALPLRQGLSTTHQQVAGRLSPCAGLPEVGLSRGGVHYNL